MSRRKPDAARVRASASVVLLDVPERPGQVAEGLALGRPVGHDVHQPERAGHAADRVPARETAVAGRSPGSPGARAPPRPPHPPEPLGQPPDAPPIPIRCSVYRTHIKNL